MNISNTIGLDNYKAKYLAEKLNKRLVNFSVFYQLTSFQTTIPQREFRTVSFDAKIEKNKFLNEWLPKVARKIDLDVFIFSK